MITLDRSIDTGATAAHERASGGEVSCTVRSLDLPPVPGADEDVARILDRPISLDGFRALRGIARYLDVTPEFREVVTYFATPAGETPAGFRVEMRLEPDGVLAFDLVRDIAHDANGVLRPTRVLFSADTANPYEIAPVAKIVANLTCNPGIVYDLFLNDPKANVGGRFRDRDEVFREIGRILGPGSDITVELDDPFADLGHVLEEAEHFREILSRWRLVIKVPHTGPVNAANVHELLEGDRHLDTRFEQPTTADAFYPHNLALAMREHGFRINFTLMFEPYQTLLALQARPYFINAFIRHRKSQSATMRGLIDAYRETDDEAHLDELRTFLIDKDYLARTDVDVPLADCLAMAQRIVAYRHFDDAEGSDGLDSVRHALRVLRGANLPDTRLIICSMEGDVMYPDIDRLLASDEYADMRHRIVVTAEPNYLARFTSANQVISYQRRFMTAAQGQR
ncbi:MAG TPA: transaldolase [Candidatus Limnocylindria bacterium]|nr:transaldolase [Candidatus Limnocylindria bacterium]